MIEPASHLKDSETVVALHCVGHADAQQALLFRSPGLVLLRDTATLALLNMRVDGSWIPRRVLSVRAGKRQICLLLLLGESIEGSLDISLHVVRLFDDDKRFLSQNELAHLYVTCCKDAKAFGCHVFDSEGSVGWEPGNYGIERCSW